MEPKKSARARMEESRLKSEKRLPQEVCPVCSPRKKDVADAST